MTFPCPIPCIVCKTAMNGATPEGLSHNQPDGGTVFSSRGQYGSTVFDPMDSTWLELNICDKCLTAAAEAGHVLHGTSIPGRAHYTRWKPEKWATVAADRQHDETRPDGTRHSS